jgi:hypothetical protein
MQSDGVARASCVNIESSKSLERIDLSTSGELLGKMTPKRHEIVFHHLAKAEQQNTTETPKRSMKKALNPGDFVRERSRPWVGDIEFIDSRKRGNENEKLQANEKPRRKVNNSPDVQKFIEEYELMKKQRMQMLLERQNQKGKESSTTTPRPSTTKQKIHQKPMKDILFGGVFSKLSRIFGIF